MIHQVLFLSKPSVLSQKVYGIDLYIGILCLLLIFLYTTNSKILDVLGPNETVTLVDSNVYNSIWYKVKTSSGKLGYCSGTYLSFATNSSAVRDLNCVNKNALIKEMLAYHHAGGICYYGLLYRRADELEMFLYGNYTSDGYKNNYNFPDPYCIKF